MAVKITADPKVPTSAAQTTTHGCCGGEAAPESKTDSAIATDHDHREHTVSSEAAESSCCCGTKSGRPAT